LRIQPAWFDALFILRPTLFFPAWTAFLAGYRFRDAFTPDLIPYLLWLAGATGAAFLLNQLVDRREDSLNRKLLPLWDGLVSGRFVGVELGVLGLVTILGGIWAGWEQSALLTLFFIISGFLYNVPPFRLKSRPILGIAACSAGGSILFVMGARMAGFDYGAAFLLSLPYVFAGAAASLLTHVPDIKGDRQSGAATFASKYGVRATAWLALFMVLAAFLSSLWLRDFVMLFAALVALPLFIRFCLKLNMEAAQTAVKTAIFGLAVAVGTTWAPFLAMIALYYPLARWYHRERLGLDYPSFGSAAKHPVAPAIASPFSEGRIVLGDKVRGSSPL
jgi:4-hydroxybenzoate polyprenyltransferase